MLPMADRALVERILPRAEAFAREAGDLTLRYFGSTMHAEDKADGSPVTEADREAEGLLRTRIAAEFPTHGIVGEEQGSHQPDAEIRWTLDPIDGTRAFMRGVPLYAVLVGVSIRDRPAVGTRQAAAQIPAVQAALSHPATRRPGMDRALSRHDGRLDGRLVAAMRRCANPGKPWAAALISRTNSCTPTR